MSNKFNIDGSLQVAEKLIVKDLEVKGTTTTVNQENLAIEDNIIITNANGGAVPDTGIVAVTGSVLNYIKGSTARYIFNSNQFNGNKGYLINQMNGVNIYSADGMLLQSDVLYMDCTSSTAMVGWVFLVDNTDYYLEFSQDTTINIEEGNITFEEFCNILNIPSSHIVKQEEAYAAPIFDADDNLLKIGQGYVIRDEKGSVTSFEFVEGEAQAIATRDYVDNLVATIEEIKNK